MSSTPHFADAFAPLEEERARIDHILARLELATNLTERADLARELVRSTSRYEDTLERAVWPLDVREGHGLDNERESVRDSMEKIHARTAHVDAINVHSPDPQGFEDELGRLMVELKALLAQEDEQLQVLESKLLPEHPPEEVASHVARIMRTASEKPRAPRTALGRALSNATTRIEHALDDPSTTQHPARPSAG